MINKITSKTNSKIKYAYSLHQAKERRENHQFLAEGFKSLELALKAGLVKEIYTLKPLPKIDKSIMQYLVNEEIIEKLAFSSSPEGVVFLCDMPVNVPSKLSKVVYLDGVSDPGNMGTIIRTAFAFGYDVVIVSNDSCNIYNEKVIAASKGSIFLMPILEGGIDKYLSNQKVIISTLNDKSISLDEVKTPESFFLVLGNEAHGVSTAVTEKGDIFVKIPMGNIDSLNVSIAGGILMYHLR